ncbi:BON domain protein [Burkholderia cenocepacia]|uniref:BON domain protein n=1 Tax=Burkholderia cenocepacia TaxID=95486 RepID=A0AAN0VN37_9BURK|nr:BON domain protein [Burkholderia cenocepacia]
MKMGHGIRAALGVAVAAVSIGAGAQSGASAGMPASAPAGVGGAASAGTRAKVMRQANRALRRKVYAALAGHREIDAGSISVTAKGGAITLNGTVAEASQLETVEQVAREVAGVTSVTNRLAVQRPLGQ